MSTATLRSYASTMVALVAAAVVVQVGWQAFPEHSWAMAVAVLVGWVVVVSGSLRAGGWRAAPLAAVTWAPAVVLALPAAAGWLSPDATVLWGPLATVLAGGLAMVVQPGAGDSTAENREECHDLRPRVGERAPLGHHRR